MYYSDHPHAGQGPVIAVIGAGASGTLTAIYLLREAAARQLPLRVALIDRHGRHGLGQAYATTHPAHLLNSPASTMSALTADPDHLARWAEQAGITHDGFLPRSAYGRYLGDLLARAERAALPAARVSRITSEVVAIRRGGRGRALRLHLAADGRIDADLTVLATGNLPPAAPGPVPDGDRYIPDPWEPGALAPAGDGSPVVVVGTGLTMLDVAIALTDANPRTTVHAVSRHALLPRAHRWPPRPADASRRPVLPGQPVPVRLTRLIRDIRTSAAQHDGDWQEVVDALRPHVPHLWEQLPDADKRRFLRRVARYWEIHRHRLPPATARQASTLIATGRLSVLRGRVIAAGTAGGDIRVRIDDGGTSTGLAAGWLVNCTGPAADITATAHPLLRYLLDAGLARPDPLRLGLDTDSHGGLRDATGRPSSDMFTLGPLLRGRWYETTAIPEIRDQAAVLARFLLTSRALAGPGNAA
ncbi:MAG TPA: FAD/NAD(P)-binding protein [Streptosporangiaceae bacterium]|nr:FAD/NAD(P)-binding protein [Streptosporangiaceae bacterium]